MIKYPLFAVFIWMPVEENQEKRKLEMQIPTHVCLLCAALKWFYFIWLECFRPITSVLREIRR